MNKSPSEPRRRKGSPKPRLHLLKLNEKHKIFCLEYLKDSNPTQAAIRAGYKKKNANITGPRMYSDVLIRREIDRLRAEQCERLQIEADEILRNIYRQQDYDVRKFFDAKHNLKELWELDDAEADAVVSFDQVTLYEGEGEQKHAFGQLRKIRLADKIKNRELLGRHLGLFKDKVEITNTNEFAGRTDAELEYYTAHGEWPKPAAPRADGESPAGAGEPPSEYKM